MGRHRHREMEAKRRRDARKIKDLQVSITPNRAIENNPIVQLYNGNVEQILSNCYCHFKDPKEFFELLSGLIGNTYSGKTEYIPQKATMICTVTKMEKLQSSNKVIQQEYKFEITLYKSKQYTFTINKNDNEQKNKENNDDNAHSQSTNKETVYVVTTKRISGDDFKFRSLQRKLLEDGALLFNGLPEWAVKMSDFTDDKFNNILNNWDDDNKEDNYDDIQWDKEEQQQD